MERDKMVEALAERLRFLCCTHVQMLDAREIRPFAQSAGRNGWLKVAGIVADEAGKAHVDEVAALQSRLAAAEAERDDLRRYRKSWDKELRDAREAAKTAIDGRIAAEAEAERARGALVEVRRMIESDAYRASITARIDAHLASRPEHNKED